MKNILILQQKGGVGKTTLCGELSRSFQRTGTPSAFYDLDQQGGCIVEPYEDKGAKVAVIDTPGSLQERMADWVAASDVIVIPTKCSKMDQAPLLRVLDIVRENKKPRSKVFIILTMFTRWTSSRDFKEWIQGQNTGAEILTLPQSEIIIQASAYGKSVIDYKPKSEPAKEALTIINAIRKAVNLPEEII